LILTDRARRDLDGIYVYITKAGGRETAQHFIANLTAHLERIALTGYGGVPRDAISPGLRLAVHGRYNIYFRASKNETIIVRVLHSARDVRRLHFAQDDTK
jgi:plasmid stabilization system protein ParE